MAETAATAPEFSRPQMARGPGYSADFAAAAARSSGSSLLTQVLNELAARRDRVHEVNPEIARNIDRLIQRGSDADAHTNVDFRRHIATTVQDAEKSLHEKLPIAPELRKELTALAGTASGVTNERVLGLLRSTENVADYKLVQSIRRFAGEVGTQPKQDTVTTASAIENFENRVRLATRAGSIPDTPKPSGTTSGQQTTFPQARAQTEPPITSAGHPADPRGPGQDRERSTIVVNRSVADALFDNIRAALGGSSAAGRPTEPSREGPPGPNGSASELPHTPMKARIEAFNALAQTNTENKTIAATEAAGHRAIEALQGLRTAAASIFTRIDEAARNNPGGILAVLSEMRPGGQFADLRKQFNAALSMDQAATAAYDQAATALARYGERRPAVDELLAKRGDAAGLTAKFQKLDAEVGEAAGRIPSHRDGKTMIEDLTKTVSELLLTAVDGVRAIFSRSPDPGPRIDPTGPRFGP